MESYGASQEAERETWNSAFTPNQSRDYSKGEATLTACVLLDQLQGQNATAAQDQVLQVNLGIIEPPESGSTVVTEASKNPRLWMKVKTQDPTGTVELWLREKAALELSKCATMDDFVQKQAQR